MLAMVEGLTSREKISNGKISFVFPGQGSQGVGMGRELYEGSNAAKGVFNEADEVLGFKISDTMFNGTEDELKITAIAQPAILTASIASFRALEETLGERMPRPSEMTGHSLGLWTALVATGVIDLRDGVRLVRERGRLMEEASKTNPGNMAAIVGIDEKIVEDVCKQTGVFIAVVNSNDQIVISGDEMAIARAVDLAVSVGARKAVLLDVSGAFHSPLMNPAKEGLRRAMSYIEFRNPQVPLVANSDGKPLTDAEAIKAELIETLCGPVRWMDAVHKMAAGGVTSFVEIGHGRVLSGLIRRIDKNVQAFNIDSPDSIQKFASTISV